MKKIQNQYEERSPEEIQAQDIYSALKESRKEPGLSIKTIASICNSVFKKEEITQLINNLKVSSIASLIACSTSFSQ